PRPRVWPSREKGLATMDRKTPPRPARAPEMITARYLYLSTLTPRDSAATGFSPQERRRRPNAVRHRMYQVAGTSATAIRVSQDTLVTRPPSSPAMSETKNQPLALRSRNASESPGTVKLPSDSTAGDCLAEPPWWPSKASGARERVAPRAGMLIATPETMWLTLQVTVTRACSRPPSAPPRGPTRTRVHGPDGNPAQAPNQVPRIIMPTRAMLTTPARCAHRPPRPARPIGTASWRALDIWLTLVMPLAPVIRRTIEVSARAPAMTRSSTGSDMRRPVGAVGCSDGWLTSVAVVGAVIGRPPPSCCCRRPGRVPRRAPRRHGAAGGAGPTRGRPRRRRRRRGRSGPA